MQINVQVETIRRSSNAESRRWLKEAAQLKLALSRYIGWKRCWVDSLSMLETHQSSRQSSRSSLNQPQFNSQAAIHKDWRITKQGLRLSQSVYHLSGGPVIMYIGGSSSGLAC